MYSHIDRNNLTALIGYQLSWTKIPPKYKAMATIINVWKILTFAFVILGRNMCCGNLPDKSSSYITISTPRKWLLCSKGISNGLLRLYHILFLVQYSLHCRACWLGFKLLLVLNFVSISQKSSQSLFVMILYNPSCTKDSVCECWYGRNNEKVSVATVVVFRQVIF